MGHDHQQSSSSGAVVAIVVAVLLVAILGLVAVAGVGLLLVGTSRIDSQPATIARQLADQDEDMAQLQHFSELGTERLNFEVKLDREGNASIDGEKISLDDLRSRLAKLKDETSNAFAVRINADPECPAKLLIPVLDVCEDVGDIDFRVVSSEGSVVQVTATVASYEPAAEWDHFDDGTFSAYDKITLQVVSPERHASTTFSVTVPPTELPEDSAFRTTGTRLSFRVRESDIGATGLAWGAIGDPAIEQ